MFDYAVDQPAAASFGVRGQWRAHKAGLDSSPHCRNELARAYVEKVVKSYRRSERGDRPAVVPVELGIETFYKTYRASRPRQLSSEDQGVIWDPSRFRTDAMKRVYADARRVAPLNVPFLIRGERGTGKLGSPADLQLTVG